MSNLIATIGCQKELACRIFEVYGNIIFSRGGKTLKRKSLDDGSESQLSWSLKHFKKQNGSILDIPRLQQFVVMLPLEKARTHLLSFEMLIMSRGLS